jgi:hypothetical protein
MEWLNGRELFDALSKAVRAGKVSPHPEWRRILWYLAEFFKDWHPQNKLEGLWLKPEFKDRQDNEQIQKLALERLDAEYCYWGIQAMMDMEHRNPEDFDLIELGNLAMIQMSIAGFDIAFDGYDLEDREAVVKIIKQVNKADSDPWSNTNATYTMDFWNHHWWDDGVPRDRFDIDVRSMLRRAIQKAADE